MFHSASKFNQPLNNLNVSKGSHFFCMFSGALTFNQDLSKWDMSSATDLSCMFMNAASFNQPLQNWNVSNVTDQQLANYKCYNIKWHIREQQSLCSRRQQVVHKESDVQKYGESFRQLRLR